MVRQSKRTAIRDQRFFEALAKCGHVARSAKYANYSRSRVFVYRKSDPEFAERWEDALAVYVELLETEARRRAYKGVRVPIFYQGVVCGYKRQYSDILLMFLLKALKPGVYREANTVLRNAGEAVPIITTFA